MMRLPSAAASLPSERRVLSVRGVLVINLKERLQTAVHANTFRGVNTVTRSNYLLALRALRPVSTVPTPARIALLRVLQNLLQANDYHLYLNRFLENTAGPSITAVELQDDFPGLQLLLLKGKKPVKTKSASVRRSTVTESAFREGIRI